MYFFFHFFICFHFFWTLLCSAVVSGCSAAVQLPHSFSLFLSPDRLDALDAGARCDGRRDRSGAVSQSVQGLVLKQSITSQHGSPSLFNIILILRSGLCPSCGLVLFRISSITSSSFFLLRVPPMCMGCLNVKCTYSRERGGIYGNGNFYYR